MSDSDKHIENILFTSQHIHASREILSEKHFGRCELNSTNYHQHETRKMDVFAVLHVQKGSGKFRLALEEYTIKKNTIYFTYPGQLISNIKFSGVNGYLLYAKPEFLLKANPNLLDFKLFQLYGQRHKIRLPKHLNSKLVDISRNIEEEQELTEYRKKDILSTLVNLHIYYTDRGFFYQYYSTEKILNPLVQKFFALMNMQQKVNMKVSDYASTLNISPNYLNEIIKKSTGKSVKTIIKEKTIRQACVYLIHTNYDVKEIAYLLEYNYPQYFDRDFKNSTGKTPTQYRQTYR